MLGASQCRSVCLGSAVDPALILTLDCLSGVLFSSDGSFPFSPHIFKVRKWGRLHGICEPGGFALEVHADFLHNRMEIICLRFRNIRWQHHENTF